MILIVLLIGAKVGLFGQGGINITFAPSPSIITGITSGSIITFPINQTFFQFPDCDVPCPTLTGVKFDLHYDLINTVGSVFPITPNQVNLIYMAGCVANGPVLSSPVTPYQSSFIIPCSLPPDSYHLSITILNFFKYCPAVGFGAHANDITTGTPQNWNLTTNQTLENVMQIDIVNPISVTPSIICEGDYGTLIANGGDSYTWSNGAVDILTDNPTTTTTYTVTAINTNGCTETQTGTITVNPLPSVTTSSTDATSCTNNDGSATATETSGSGTYSYLWNPTSQTTPTAINLTVGAYSVLVTNSTTGCSTTAPATVNISGTTYAYPAGFNSSGSVTWNSGTTLTVNGNIIVNNGSVFTITSGTTVEFAPNSGIIIKSGGVMNLNGYSILKGLSTCGNMWNGIDINGNDNLIVPGTLVATNATIQDAHNGTISEYGDWYFNYSEGGVIQATNVTLLNNRIGIKMTGQSFMQSISAANSFITNCTFSCTAPLLDVISYNNEGTKNFIDLDGIRDLVITSNNFQNYYSFPLLNLGTGIYSQNSDYTVTDNNYFYDLTTGIDAYSTGTHITVDNHNHFINVQQGIHSTGGYLDNINWNHFIDIPTATVAHTYGINMDNSSGFDINNNAFTGYPSTIVIPATDPGSHGIIFINTDAIGGECYHNTFGGTDYAVHTQQQNQTLRIRCNIFANLSPPHNISAMYIYDGSLKQQGLITCNVIGNGYQAAGNTWVSTTASTNEQDIYNPSPVAFDYYANQHDAFIFTTTVPVSYSSAWTGLSVTCQDADGTTCQLEFQGINTNGNNWVNDMRYQIGENDALIRNDKEQVEILKSLNDDSVFQQIADYEKEIEWYRCENQLMENKLMREFTKNNMPTDAVTMLLGSDRAEAQKVLAEYYLKIKDYTSAKTALAKADSITSADATTKDSVMAVAESIEMYNYSKYMNVIIAVADSEKTIFQMDTTQLNTLREVADAKVKISANAEIILKQVQNLPFDHPIKKDGSKRLNHTKPSPQQQNQDISLKVFPNPFPDKTNVEYFIPDNLHAYSIYLVNEIGQMIIKYQIVNQGSGQITIDGSLLNNGIYTCQLVSDSRIISVTKIVIIK